MARPKKMFAGVEVVFDRRGVTKKDADKVGAVEIVVRWRSEKRVINSGMRVHADEWSDRMHFVKRRDASELNRRLDAHMKRVRDVVAECEAGEFGFSFGAFDAAMASAEYAGRTSWPQFIRDECEASKNAEGTKKHHRAFANLIEEYGKLRTFADLTPRNIMAFYDWVGERKTPKLVDGEIEEVAISQETIFTYHKRMRTYINKACRKGLMKENPMDHVVCDHGITPERDFLEEDEYERMRDCKITAMGPYHARDLFVMQCNTGLSYCDLVSYDFENDVAHKIDGSMTLSGYRGKTGIYYHVRLLPDAVKVLEKYGWKLPVMASQSYNKFLKDVADFAKIKKHLTTHIGRHTFACRALDADVPLEVLQKMMGHKDIQTTLIYAKMKNKKIDECMGAWAKNSSGETDENAAGAAGA